jgi:hypothetical protein
MYIGYRQKRRRATLKKKRMWNKTRKRWGSDFLP